MKYFLVNAALLPVALIANDNGLAITPPMGWRSWNLFFGNVDQELIQGIMDGMVVRKREVNGVKMSLRDLGYSDVGLDDAWQLCGSYGKKNFTFHLPDGTPVVNKTRFPDFKAMTDHAHSLNLTSGWYGNTCICREKHTDHRRFYEGDVKALREYGFDSWKLDGCGSQLNLELYDELIKESGPPVMVENCHWGRAKPYEPTPTWCPWNMYRTSGDVRANYASVMYNLATVTHYARSNLSTPGCWAYPDMLEVGCHTDGQGGRNADFGLNMAETRSHFGAWAIVSSPLILSHDVNNDTVMDAIWPIIANTEVIEVNQAWFGHSGSPFKTSSENISFVEPGEDVTGDPPTYQNVTVDVPTYQYYYKPLCYRGSRIAVLMMNSDEEAMDLSLNFADVPGLSCSTCRVRDIWNHKDLGVFHERISVRNIASHDAAFLIISSPTNISTSELISSLWIGYSMKTQMSLVIVTFALILLVVRCISKVKTEEAKPTYAPVRNLAPKGVVI